MQEPRSVQLTTECPCGHEITFDIVQQYQPLQDFTAYRYAWPMRHRLDCPKCQARLELAIYVSNAQPHNPRSAIISAIRYKRLWVNQ